MRTPEEGEPAMRDWASSYFDYRSAENAPSIALSIVNVQIRINTKGAPDSRVSGRVPTSGIPGEIRAPLVGL
jgi:hypothetical protein